MPPGTRPLARRNWQSAIATVVVGAALGALAGCGDGPLAVADRPPRAPAENDPTFSVRGVPGWRLVGNPLTPGQDELPVEVVAPSRVDVVDAFVGALPGIRLTQGDDGRFRGVLDIAALPVGEHDLLLAADSSDEAFARLVVRRSHPLYVVVSTDWDDPDNSELALTLQEELHDEHPELILTHFVGPYTFTDPAVSAARQGELVDWVTGMRDRHGDEIGLHIHAYCSFVAAAGLPCRTSPSSVYRAGDATGYTVMLNAYEHAELVTMLRKADELFVDNGLGKPTSFRAGGWIADLRVLSALAEAGHVADTSANNWARLEEWEGVENGVLYEWNRTNWSTIGDTSQPYYPSAGDVLAAAAAGEPHVGILEVRDNGILVDYVTREEMIGIFDANFDGAPLAAPRAYSIGYHPSNFVRLYKDRIHYTLLHAEQFLASTGRGPVVYARLSDLATVWVAP
jgi:hypothetical protein